MPRFPSINIGSGGGSGGGSGVSSAWGGITGTLAAQADLKAALDAKADDGAELTATWGQIAGSISSQADLMAYLGGGGVPGVEVVAFQFGSDDIDVAVTAGPRRDYVRPTMDFTIVGWLATVFRPSTTTAMQFDVNVNGLSVFNTDKIKIDANEKSSSTAATPAEGLYINVHAFSEVTIDVDAAGANAGGWRLTVYGIRADHGDAGLVPVNTISLPTISGAFTVGSTITVSSNGSWDNAPIGYSYEWLRDGAVIDWTSGGSYVITAADAGRTLAVRVTASNGAGSATANSAGSVVVMPVPVNISAPSIGSSGTEGQQLTTTTGGWLFSPSSFLYVWQTRATLGDAWAAISGAITARFTPSAGLVGHQVRSGVQAINVSGPSASMVYSAGVTIEASRFSAPWPPAPKAIGLWGDPTLPLTGTGDTHNVGPNPGGHPGIAHTDLQTVPWLSLGPGDVVNIFYREAPYLSKIGLTCQGTANEKVCIHGVMTAGGLRPHIQGDGALTPEDLQSPDGVTEPFFNSQYTEFLGVILISHHYESGVLKKPQHIVIENLKITGGWSQTHFTNQYGDTIYYAAGGAGIYASVVEYLDVENCEITDNSNGFFSNSNNDLEARTSYYITLRRNLIYDNGEPGEPYEHNIYMQCVRPLIEGNYIGKLRPTSGGSSCKDRSSGTVVRFNTINAAARALDLVDAEDGGAIVRLDPLYPYGWVYGNFIDNDWMIDNTRTSSVSMIHWSGDNSVSSFRNGSLYIYNNTIRINANTENFYHITVFSGVNLQSKFIITNNVIAKYGTTYLSWLDSGNVAELYGTNVISSGTSTAFSGSATLTNYGTLIEVNDPLVNPDGSLQDGSPGIGAGLAVITAPPAPAYAPNLQVLFKPVHPGSYEARVPLGVGSDAGCYETATGTPAPPPPPPPAILEPIEPSRVMNFNETDGLSLSAINYKWAGSPTHYITAGNGLRMADAYIWTAQRTRWVDGQGANQAISIVRRGQSWGAMGGDIGLTLQDDGENFYVVRVGKTGWQLHRNGVWMDSDSLTNDWTVDTTITCSITDGAVVLKINGVVISTLNYTDGTPLTGGYPGFFLTPIGSATAHVIESLTDTP